MTTVTIMSMAIHRASSNVVPVMLNPIAKLGRLAKVGTGNSKSASATSPAAAQSASRPQPASSTPEQIHTAFKYALAGLSGTGTGTTAQPSTEEQSSGAASAYARAALSSTAQSSPADVQQTGSAYAQVEQQAGQALDLTA